MIQLETVLLTQSFSFSIFLPLNCATIKLKRNGIMRDEYDFIYDNDAEMEEYYFNAINELRGTVGRGDCMYCGAKNGMVYEGHICFICNTCGMGVHEDLYYRWLAGDNIKE